jgi:hypothetical protein
MSLTKEAIESLSNIIINVISGDISNGRDRISDKISFWRFKRQISKWIKLFINQHDGTILIQGCFHDYLKYYNPIERIYNYISKPNIQEVCKEEFLSMLSDLCIEKIKKDGFAVPALEEKLPKKMFVEIYDKYKSYLENKLTESEKYMLSEIEQARFGIEKITDGVVEGNSKLDEIIYKLESQNKLDDKSEIEDIYNCLNSKLMKGEISEVKKLFPLLKGKNTDLENALEIKVSALEEDEMSCFQVAKLLMKFTNLSIRNDVIRLLVIINIDNCEFLRCISDILEEGSLKQLIDVVCEEQWDNIIFVESVIEGVVKEYHYKLTDNYKDEDWLRKRMAVYYINTQPLVNIERSVDLLLDDNRNFLDVIFSLYKKIEYVIQYKAGELPEEKKHQLLKWQEELLSSKWIYLSGSIKIGIMYCTALFRTMLILRNGNIEEEYESIPQKLQNVDSIKAFTIQSKIDKGSIEEDKLIEFCIKSKNYWLLNNYCLKYNLKTENIIQLLEKCKIILEKDIFIFLIYVQAINISKGSKAATILMNEYKDIYEKNLNYWIIYMKLDSDILIDDIFQKWSNGEIVECDFEADIDFVNELMTRKEYEKAARVIDKLEKLKIVTPLLLKMKSKVLIEQGYEIDALKELVKIYPHFTDDPYVIDTILVISLNGKRKVSSEVIQSAEKIGSSRLLMLVACLYEMENMHEDAIKTITKALLKSTSDEKDIYGKYVGIHISSSQEEDKKVICVDRDTTVYLRDIENHKERIYCVHSEQTLDYEHYVWENSTHIYTSRAIEMGLLRKKKGDLIQIDGSDYEVIEIMTVDCFLFRTCLKKLRDIGGIKEYSLPISSDGQLNIEDFTLWIKENTQSGDNKYKWLDNYKDFANTPPPLYALHRFTRLMYSQFIMSLLGEKTVIIRDLLPKPEIKSDNRFVLSYSSVIMMYKLGVDLNYINKFDVLVPESTKIMIEGESNEIYKSTNRETVATMGVIEDRLFMQEDSEDEKLRKMREAVNLKNYVQQISDVKNDSDIRIEELKQWDMKSFIGICDYDAIVISRNEDRNLVSSEVFISALANIEGSRITATSLVDFLCMMQLPADNLIEYIIKMVDFQFQIFLTPTVTRYLIKEAGNIEDDELREALLVKWINLLSLGDELVGEYKGIFIEMLTDIFRSLYEENTNNTNPMWINLKYFVFKYNIQGA